MAWGYSGLQMASESSNCLGAYTLRMPRGVGVLGGFVAWDGCCCRCGLLAQWAPIFLRGRMVLTLLTYLKFRESLSGGSGAIAQNAITLMGSQETTQNELTNHKHQTYEPGVNREPLLSHEPPERFRSSEPPKLHAHSGFVQAGATGGMVITESSFFPVIKKLDGASVAPTFRVLGRLD